MNLKSLVSALALCVYMTCGCSRESSTVELYRVFEITFEAGSPGSNPYLNGPEVTALFRGISDEATGSSYKINGFWDGGKTWKIRFAPDKAGLWSYETSSSDRGLDGKKGTIKAIKPYEDNLQSNVLFHGFLERDGDYSWKLSDGTPFLPIGDTQWSFSEEFSLSEWKEWIDVISGYGYNTFMGSVWLGKYSRFENDPFEKKDPSGDSLITGFFREKLDSMVIYANDKGIMMGLVIGGFPDNSQWFRKFSNIEQNDRWFRYIIARYSAFNVRWGLFGEIDEASGRFALEDKSWQWVEQHYAQLVKENDPYRHPVGSHSTRVDTVAASDPNIDFIEVQEGDRKDPNQFINAMSLRKWNKPVWYEEYWYEMDGDQDIAIRNTHRNFIHALAFPTMGSLMRNHQLPEYLFPPDEAKKQGISLSEYLVRNDTGMIRMSWFADFYKVLADDLDEFSPVPELANRGECSRFGKNFAVFLTDGGKFTLDLSGETGDFNVRCLSIRTGEVRTLNKVSGGTKPVIDTEIRSDAAVLILSSHPGTL